MQKSADAFRTISEVADDLSLPQHVLRFWETRFAQIRPLKRAGGRRYYRPTDVLLLRAIRTLLYDDGYTIKGVQRLLKEQGAKGLGVKGFGGRDLDARDLNADSGATFDDAPPDDDDDALDHGLDVEAALESLAPHPAPPEPHSSTERAQSEGSVISDGIARCLIEDALATVNDCLQILEALLRPAQ